MNISASTNASISLAQRPNTSGVSKPDEDKETSEASQNEQNTPIDDTKNKETAAAEKVQKAQDESILRGLKSRDREVRAHESAHAAAGGSLVSGGPSFTFQAGPDGRSYAIGGEVKIDTAPVAGDPQATIVKANQVRAAALAPAEPSGQDRKVASNATQLAAQARVELAVQRREESKVEEIKTEEKKEVAAASDKVFAATDSNEQQASTETDAAAMNNLTVSANKAANAIGAFIANTQPDNSAGQQFNQYA